MNTPTLTFDAGHVLEEIAAVSETVFDTPSQAIEAYLALILRLTKVSSAFVARVDTRGFYVQYAVSDDPCGVTTDQVFLRDAVLYQYMSLSDTPVIVMSPAQKSHLNSDHSTYASPALSPEARDNPFMNALCLLSPQLQAFAHEQIDVLRIIAHHIASIIERELPATAPKQPSLISIERDVFMQVAHDIRTPLTSILGYVEMLQMCMLGPLSAEQNDALMHIHSNVQLINRLVNDLVDVVDPGTDALTFVSTTFQPESVAQFVVDSCQMQARERGLVLHHVSAQRLPIMKGDESRLCQILFNFVNNALRYTEQGSIVMYVTQQETQIQFSVIDTGLGIAPQHQQAIWQPHTRVNTAQPGLGLGLSIARRLASAMGGTVGMHSTLGQGSTFWVRLPIQGLYSEAREVENEKEVDA